MSKTNEFKSFDSDMTDCITMMCIKIAVVLILFFLEN